MSDVTEYRDQLATERGLSDQERDLLLTGADPETLLMQADRLSPLPDRTRGNVAPREGRTVERDSRDQSMLEFTRDLFGRDDV